MRKRKQELAKEQDGAGDDNEEMAKKADLGKNIKIESKSYIFFKVNIFWEGHKILRNLHLTLVLLM